MLLAPLKQLLQQVKIKGVDGEKIWSVLQAAQCYIVDDLKELEHFSAMGLEATPTRAMLIASEVPGAIMFAALVPVDTCGLANFLYNQLSYVPKYAILEWYFLPENSGFRDLVVCLGYHGLTETYADSVLGFAALTGKAPPEDLIKLIADDNDVIKSWCFGTLQALDSRNMLLHRQVEHNRTQVSLAHYGYTHAIH